MPNDDCIKRSDALFELYRYASAKDPPLIIEHRLDICERIESIPAADVEPVKHGRWVEQEEWGDTYYTCSVCKGDFVTLDGASPAENDMHYCPYCGAHMDGEDENA